MAPELGGDLRIVARVPVSASNTRNESGYRRRKLMTKIRVSKVDAACRQIDAAIRMLFDNGDPVAIHTLAAAGGRILRDLCERKGTKKHQMMMDHIVPGKEKDFWRVMNRPANFFKHAEQDPEEILDGLDERVNDFTTYLAVEYYRDLGYAPTAEMRALLVFIIVTNPDLMRTEASSNFRQLVSDLEWLRQSSRPEQLTTAKQVLREIRRQV
jgi:hypothetical protein